MDYGKIPEYITCKQSKYSVVKILSARVSHLIDLDMPCLIDLTKYDIPEGPKKCYTIAVIQLQEGLLTSYYVPEFRYRGY